MTGEHKPTTEWTVSDLSAEELAVRAVALLKEHKKTIATAESCTGGLVAAALTDVPGSSAVIGTGVVAYSWECKQRLLDVERAALEQYGAVSAQVAQQMAQGVRRRSGADLGVAVTGEAGPVAGEQQPVGTVYIALADCRRTWVKELHLDGDRGAIRRKAAFHLLDLIRRYMEAYPAVMAGGVSHRVLTRQPVIPKAEKSGGHAWLRLVLPHRSDSPRRLVLKIAAWLLAVAVLVCSLWLGYLYLVAPDANQDLQASLGELYWGDTESTSLSEEDTGDYPKGMMATFRGLYDRNPDVVGWLRIPGTPVDYPVMDYADGLYENHSFDGQYSLYGQPHFGEGITLSSDSPVMQIYGRNTGNGQMFSSLLDYRRLAYVKENAIIEFNTLYATHSYEIFAVAVADDNRLTDWDYTHSNFTTAEEYEAFIRSLQSHSLYRTDGVVTAQDALLLLCTDAESEYGFSGARLIVAARRMTDRDTITAYHINSQAIMPAAMYRPQPTRSATTVPSAGSPTSTAVADKDGGTTVNKTTETVADLANTTTVPSGTQAETGTTTLLDDEDGRSTTVAEKDRTTTVAGSTTSETIETTATVDNLDGISTTTATTSAGASRTRTSRAEMTAPTQPGSTADKAGDPTHDADNTTRTNTKQMESE